MMQHPEAVLQVHRQAGDMTTTDVVFYSLTAGQAGKDGMQTLLRGTIHGRTCPYC
jgi:hypothetical protein